jgi:hypothetical protein
MAKSLTQVIHGVKLITVKNTKWQTVMVMVEGKAAPRFEFIGNI